REFQRLVEKHQVKTIIETGTYLGESTVALSLMVPTIHTVEVNQKYFDRCVWLQEFPNIHRHLGNSPDVIDQLIPTLDQPAMFFLDSHWGDHCPLWQEIDLIAKHAPDTSVIAIHDFYNPEHPEYGFDHWNGM